MPWGFLGDGGFPLSVAPVVCLVGVGLAVSPPVIEVIRLVVVRVEVVLRVLALVTVPVAILVHLPGDGATEDRRVSGEHRVVAGLCCIKASDRHAPCMPGHHKAKHNPTALPWGLKDFHDLLCRVQPVGHNTVSGGTASLTERVIMTASVIIPRPLTDEVVYPEVVLPVVTINYSTVKRLLHEAVRLKGANHVQGLCVYGVREVEKWDGDGKVEVEAGVGDEKKATRPGCIVGVVLWNLLGPEAFQKAIVEEGLNGNTFDNVYANVPGYTFTPRAVRVLTMAQRLQDGRGSVEPLSGNLPWGQAVEVALVLCEPIRGLDDDDSY